MTEALPQAIRQRMLEIVQELERNGQNLQHFCRELARYFRNLLVAKIAGRDAADRGVAQPSRNGCAQTAQRFREEDLTRYLQLSLDLFKDCRLRFSRVLHLEIGLLRLVQAGRLLPIEEALAAMNGRARRDRAVAAATLPPPKPRTGRHRLRWIASRKAAAPRTGTAEGAAPVAATAAGDCPAPADLKSSACTRR